MPGGMANGCNDNALIPDDVDYVVGKSWDIDAPIATWAFVPKKGLAHNGCANALDLGSEAGAQA
jgi:hypothetical protein